MPVLAAWPAIHTYPDRAVWPSPDLDFRLQLDAHPLDDAAPHHVDQLEHVARRRAGMGDDEVRVALADLGLADSLPLEPA